ncbi:MAG TPA: DUF1707 domain-containing protein [Gaiellaceae bacterium]|jgi:hypothetical protein|nr:DUF1707 domain-containing protein [Gaiellaceae bacterium]
MRVGDRDRELAASALGKHYVNGRLSADELEERVGRSLQARTRKDLDKALKDMPLVWEDFRFAQRVQRGRQRVGFFFRLVRSWFKVNMVLGAALAVALIVGAPIAATIGAALLAWSVATYAFWRIWQRS